MCTTIDVRNVAMRIASIKPQESSLGPQFRRTNALWTQSTKAQVFLCFSLLFFITALYFWINRLPLKTDPAINDDLVQEVLLNVAQDFRYAEVYRKTERLPKDIKYILVWKPDEKTPFDQLGKGQSAFIENNCSVINCYITSDRNFFGYDLSSFDAIAINGRYINQVPYPAQLPRKRFPHQKYIFFNTESSSRYPICETRFNGLINWTSTYKLDSDIPYPYILIRNKEGNIVGPKLDMKWEDHMHVEEDTMYKIQNKTKAAAWFVSNCDTKSKREKYVHDLQKALDKYLLHIDIYGDCGTFKCHRHLQPECEKKLERDYFFYLSFENSFADDYVTEKLLIAVKNDVIPIVYGGANYTRFLPPHSYLDATAQPAEELADKMYQLIKNPDLYFQYFKWKSFYTYHNPLAAENVCAVCAALNNKTMFETYSVYDDFRKWWNPNFVKDCVNMPRSQNLRQKQFLRNRRKQKPLESKK